MPSEPVISRPSLAFLRPLTGSAEISCWVGGAAAAGLGLAPQSDCCTDAIVSLARERTRLFRASMSSKTQPVCAQRGAARFDNGYRVPKAVPPQLAPASPNMGPHNYVHDHFIKSPSEEITTNSSQACLEVQSDSVFLKTGRLLASAQSDKERSRWSLGCGAQSTLRSDFNLPGPDRQVVQDWNFFMVLGVAKLITGERLPCHNRAARRASHLRELARFLRELESLSLARPSCKGTVPLSRTAGRTAILDDFSTFLNVVVQQGKTAQIEYS